MEDPKNANQVGQTQRFVGIDSQYPKKVIAELAELFMGDKLLYSVSLNAIK